MAVKAPRTNLPAEYRRILVVLFGAIGDVILSTPLVQALRRGAPRARITYMVGATAAPVLEHLPLLDELCVVPDYEETNLWSDLKLSGRILEGRFDLAISLSRSNKIAVAFWLARIPVRVGYLPIGGAPLFTHRIDGDALGNVHRTRYFLEAARRLEFPIPDSPELRYRVTTDERTEARRLLGRLGSGDGAKLVAIHPGTSRVLVEKRRWAPENFIEVGKHLERRGYRVVLLGGEAEREVAGLFRSALSPRMIDLTGVLGLRQLAAVLERCGLLVHNDSSPMHLAAAVGTPVLAVFGYQNTELWGPLGAHDRVVRRELPCSPCLPEFPCPRSFECIRQLEPSEVIRNLDAMLLGLEEAR